MSRVWGWCTGLLCLLGSSGAWAQQCSSSGFGINFGTVALGGIADVMAPLPYKCQANANDTYYRVCLFVPEGSAGTTNDMSGVNPRKLTNYKSGTVFYTLYSDAARSQVLGPLGSGYPDYTAEFMVPRGWNQPDRSLNVYGRAGPVAAETAAGAYEAQIGGIEIRYAWSNSGYPADCMHGSGGSGSANVGFHGVRVQVSNSCIASVSATNLDFGSVSSLATAIVGTSTITLICPPNTSWRIGLNDGQHAAGTQRRMAGPGGGYVHYELYRNVGRTQRWGNDTAGGTDIVSGSGGNPASVTVYGRVPAQSEAAPGSYSDTVTVTLSY